METNTTRKVRMNTDRELLELAAKAAGMHPDHWQWNGYGIQELAAHGVPHCGFQGAIWNPLADDGDALRLAVQLGLGVRNDLYTDAVFVSCFEIGGVEVLYGRDRFAATRRAIVRAAAEIGK